MKLQQVKVLKQSKFDLATSLLLFNKDAVSILGIRVVDTAAVADGALNFAASVAQSNEEILAGQDCFVTHQQ